MIIWHGYCNIAYKDGTKASVELVKDEYGFRIALGTTALWNTAKKLPKFAEFLSTIGITVAPSTPENVASYNFRFSATTTNGSVYVLGSNDALANQVVTNNLDAVTALLLTDSSYNNYVVKSDWLLTVFEALAASYSEVTALVPDMYKFWDDIPSYGEGGPVPTGINDGGDDMYDGGNFLNTNLTQTYDQANNGQSDSEAGAAASIPYTHTQADNEDDDVEYENPPMDGTIEPGDDYFGVGSKYFTNMYPGLFVMAADNIDITEFSITGNLGADGSGEAEGYSVYISAYDYMMFFKWAHDGEDGDPTVNHIILVPGSPIGLSHEFDTDTNYDDHVVFGLGGRNHILYALVATSPPNGPLNTSQALAIANKILQLIS